MWKDLSIQQKSEVMKMAISQGLTDLNEIKKMYDASIPNIEASSVNNTYSSVPYNPSPKDVRYDDGGHLYPAGGILTIGATSWPQVAINTVRNRLYDNLVPFGYHHPTERVYNSVIANKKELLEDGVMDDDTKETLDALWGTYLNIPNSNRHSVHSNNAIERSQGPDPNKVYYRLNNLDPIIDTVVDEGIGYEMSIRKDPRAPYVYYPHEGLKVGESKIVPAGNQVLGDFTVGRGRDDRGEYLSYSDTWDINPWQKTANQYGQNNEGSEPFLSKVARSLVPKQGDASFGIGTPVNIYDKIYLDDLYGLSSDAVRGTMYLPEVTIWGKANPRKRKINLSSPSDTFAYGGPLGNIYKGTGNKSQKLNIWTSGAWTADDLASELLRLGVRARVTSKGRSAKQQARFNTPANRSWHVKNKAIDVVPTTNWDDLKADLLKPEVRSLFNSVGIGVLDERPASVQRKTGATGAHFHIGPDRSARAGYATWTNSKMPNGPQINVESPVFHTAANDLQWQPTIVASSRQEDIAPLLVQNNKPLIIEPLEDTSSTPKDFSAIWDQIFPKVENTQEEFNPLLDPSTQFTALQSRPRYQMKPTPIINMPISNGDNDYMLFKPLAKGGNLFDTGSFMTNIFNKVASNLANINLMGEYGETLPTLTITPSSADRFSEYAMREMFPNKQARRIAADDIFKWATSNRGQDPNYVIDNLHTLYHKAGKPSLNFGSSLINVIGGLFNQENKYRSNYLIPPFNTITVPKEYEKFDNDSFLNNYLAELSHALQYNDMKKDVEDVTTYKDFIDPEGSYDRPHTVEYNAHNIIEPEIKSILKYPKVVDKNLPDLAFPGLYNSAKKEVRLNSQEGMRDIQRYLDGLEWDMKQAYFSGENADDPSDVVFRSLWPNAKKAFGGNLFGDGSFMIKQLPKGYVEAYPNMKVITPSGQSVPLSEGYEKWGNTIIGSINDVPHLTDFLLQESTKQPQMPKSKLLPWLTDDQMFYLSNLAMSIAWGGRDAAVDRRRAAKNYPIGGPAQATYLLPRDVQENKFLEFGYQLGKDGDYGLVKKAVGDSNLPIYQRWPDDINREDLIVIGNSFSDPQLKNIWIKYGDFGLEHAGHYPTAYYLGAKDHAIYGKAWDLNDYGGGTGASKRYGFFKRMAADLLDKVGSPVVVTTGFKKLNDNSLDWILSTPELKATFEKALGLHFYPAEYYKDSNGNPQYQEAYFGGPEITITP